MTPKNLLSNTKQEQDNKYYKIDEFECLIVEERLTKQHLLLQISQSKQALRNQYQINQK